MKGYAGKILKVDLSSGNAREVKLEEADLIKYIGGSGLGAKYLIESTDGDTDPLGEDNVLIFMTGPLVNTRSFSSDRFEVITKSPLGGYSEANCGGKWGSMLKRSGFDGIIITGRSKRPVSLWINEGKAEIIAAEDIWGQDTFETEEALKKNTSNKAEVACIGPGGENLVKYANISTGGVHARVAGRSGAGAVMGSQKL
jgi:aldehyde:ferredoxin oxidoreductase